MATFESATFGNKNGSHQLLGSSLPASTSVLDTLRFLVDRPAGHVGPEVAWFPYWGCQKIEGWWALWRGEEDSSAPRRNMVTAKVALIPVAQCETQENLTELFGFLGHLHSSPPSPTTARLAALAVEALGGGQRPVVVLGLSLAPLLLQTVWPRLWASARASFSIKTLFGVESLASASDASIVVVPTELANRWRGQSIMNQEAVPGRATGMWFGGTGAEKMSGLIAKNADCLPGDLSVLGRIERIVERLRQLATPSGSLSDALVVVRTLEGLPSRFSLERDDLEAIAMALSRMDFASVSEVRSASLTKLDSLGDLSAIEAALARWVQTSLPGQPSSDALWMLEQQSSPAHSSWWKRGVRNGIATACSSCLAGWGPTIWRLWIESPAAFDLLADHLPSTQETEDWLLSVAPTRIGVELRAKVEAMCGERDWPRLLAKTMDREVPLIDCIGRIRARFSAPERSLGILLDGRSPQEIVDASALSGWPPLVAQATSYTISNRQLLIRAPKAGGLSALLSRHLSVGGDLPAELAQKDYLHNVFDAAIAGTPDDLDVVRRLGGSTAHLVLDYPKCDQLIGHLNAELVRGVTEAWWSRFLSGQRTDRPPSSLLKLVVDSARSKLGGRSVLQVIAFLELFPEVTEAQFENWTEHTGFEWRPGTYQDLAALLISRKWSAATKTFRYSWKKELKIVSWYARELLSFSHQFIFSPDGLDNSATPAETRNLRPLPDIAIGIVTIKEEEYAAVLDKLKPGETRKGANRDYDVATIDTPNGPRRVAVTRSLHQGNGYAQSTVTELLADLKPGFVLVVGIAGGVPAKDFCLGDVVVSDYIQDLTIEDTGATQADRRFNAMGGPLHPSAARIVERMLGVERGAPEWSGESSIGFTRPALTGEFTTGDTEWNGNVEDALKKHAVRNRPLATARKIASSDRLIKDPELIKTWRSVLKAVGAVEMEIAGAYIPCQRNNIPVLAIRGISDVIGWRRDEAWTLYACHTVAAYVRMLISAGAFG